MALEPGTRLGPYEILAPLGAGGMGEVYRARDTRLERTVAIKVLPEHLSATADLKTRFEREARAVSSLNHPHICTLYDIGEQDGVDYLVMEHIEGETLAARLERGPLPTPEVLRYAAEIADALDKAHRQGLVHRDLKPGNVMLTKSGAKLLDFGLARIMVPGAGGASGSIPAGSMLSQHPTVATPLTGAGMIVGTFQYMAPEQLDGGEADARSDIWAFGATVYEM
ncbi:MAG: serine/threonine-protein kinase, partial [Candidatus Eiseniibacteriota bacterium]